jgi:uncharacterized protein YcbX
MTETADLRGEIAALWRHPLKGFTPEPLMKVALRPGEGLPFDRCWAVEHGPSGFDPAAPTHISKFRFVALAPMPSAARVRTRLDDATGRLHAAADGAEDISADLEDPADAQRFAAWLTAVLGEAVEATLKVTQAPGHRFFDHPQGLVSLTSLASLTALEAAVGAPLDPRRLRGNIEIAGWPAFAETDLRPGQRIRLGAATAEVFQPIQRCVATHVNPQTAEADIALVPALQRLTGHANCGVYVHILEAGDVRVGDGAEVLA